MTLLESLEGKDCAFASEEMRHQALSIGNTLASFGVDPVVFGDDGENELEVVVQRGPKRLSVGVMPDRVRTLRLDGCRIAAYGGVPDETACREHAQWVLS